MKLGVRPKLFLVSLGLIILCVIALDLIVSSRIVPVIVSGIQDDLTVRIGMARREIRRADLGIRDAAAWDALADSLGRYAEARVTIIRADGVVLGDSDVDPAALPEVENHAGRPEVVEALSRGRGVDTRYSRTLRERMMYVAVPFELEGAIAGVVRMAVPLTAVDRALVRFRAMLLAGTIAALAVAVLFSSLAATWMSRPIRSLTVAARRLASGELSYRTHLNGRDEIAELGQALDRLAENLSRSLDRLRSDHDQQEHILNDLREGVMLLGPDGRVVMVNPALRDMWLVEGEVVGRLPLEITRQAELHALFDGVRRTRSDQSTEMETGGPRPRRLLARAGPLSGGSGGVLGVFVDVTDLRRLETVRRDFVANVSHELRTPVATIRSAAETLRESARDDPVAAASFLSIIERNAERMSRLVDDLLELSRIEAGAFRLNAEPVHAADAAEPVLAALRESANARRIRLLMEIPRTVPPVLADRGALEQILTNLTGNAVKYSSEGASVTVRATTEGDRVRIAVEDTGPGIPPQYLSRIFERFYRVDTGRSREEGGTGLGLAIVRHLVEAMGGEVRVQSTPGTGSTFSFSIPAAPAPTE